MKQSHRSGITRRGFVRRGGLIAGGVLLGSSMAGGQPEPAEPLQGHVERGILPRRVLGRTRVPVTALTLGTAPCGLARGIAPDQIARLVSLALDLGVTSIDTAPAYQKAEEGVGLGLGHRRKEVFLATKVWADTVDKAEKTLANSLKLLKTDCVDLLYYHSLGNRQVERALDEDGVFTWLLKQKKAGKCRFVGISGHNRPDRFPRFLETGQVDVVLSVVNPVDRHTYDFESRVLPLVRKHQAGLVAMKVFGGSDKASGGYQNPKSPPLLPREHLELAVRYALGTPGVTTVNLGVHNETQLRENVRLVSDFRPLSAEEAQAADALGRRLAPQWGPHFGPVS